MVQEGGAGHDNAQKNVAFSSNNNGNDANTVLLVIGDGTQGSQSFNDLSASNHTVTANGNIFHIKTNRLANISSYYLDGTTDGLSVPDHNDFDITGDFTIESWVYYNDRPDQANDVYRIAARGDLGVNNGDWAFGLGNVAAWGGAGYKMNFAIRSGGAVTDYACDAIDVIDAPADTWNHWCIVRSGSDLLFFLNGALIKTVASATESMSGTTSFYVGCRLITAALGECMKGLMDEFRLSNVARYTTDFTPAYLHNGYDAEMTDGGGNDHQLRSRLKL